MTAPPCNGRSTRNDNGDDALDLTVLAAEHGLANVSSYQQLNEQDKDDVESADNDEESKDNDYGGEATDQISSSPTSWTLQLLDYAVSDRFRELAACFIFFVMTHVVFTYTSGFWKTVVLNQRPIPVQVLQDGEAVPNPVFAEVYHGETVPGNVHKWLLYIPLLIQLALSGGLARCRDLGDLHGTCCVYLVAMGLNEFATKALKYYVGYLRPVFLDLCKPNDDYTECQNLSDKIRKSFPSSHSSTTFAVATLLALYLHHRLGVHSQKRWVTVPCHVDGQLSSSVMVVQQQHLGSSRQVMWARFMSFLAVLPMGAAAFIACSRIVDNMHFPADVVAGSLIGYGCAAFAHSLWFA